MRDIKPGSAHIFKQYMSLFGLSDPQFHTCMFQTSEDDVSVTRQTTSIEPLERLEEHLEIKSTMDGYEALKGLSTSVFFFLIGKIGFPAPCLGCGLSSVAV